METAAMLSQIGLLTLPGQCLEKLYQGQALSSDEQELFHRHPQIGAELLQNIPRLEEVAEIIRCQDLSLEEKNGVLPLESRILKVILDYDLYSHQEKDTEKALARLKEHPERYEANVLEALEQKLKNEARYEAREAIVEELRPGMIINHDVHTLQGLLLIAGGQEIGPVIIEQLRNYKQTAKNIPEPIQVLVPSVLENTRSAFGNGSSRRAR
jgi:hypothetical protein